MNTRRGLLALAGLAATAGCSGAGLLNATTTTRGLRIDRAIAYAGDRANSRLALDLYRPASVPTALAVFFYGGSWQFGRREDYLFVAAELARHGIAVAVPDYRVYPEVRYPGFLRDGAAAFAFAQAQAARWGVDRPVFLIGHSAGAYIAAMLALDARWLGTVGRARIAGWVGISGPYDFLPIARPDIRAVFGAAADDPDCQPITHADHQAPPTLLLTGLADTTVEPRNTFALAARLHAAGAAVATRSYVGVDHIGTIAAFAPLLRMTAPVLADVTRFVADPGA